MKKPTHEKTRYISIDYIRTLAIICVVVVHSVENVYALNIDSVVTYSLTRQLYAFSLFTIGRLGVPLFFFISGYLLLDREYNYEKTIKFYRHNLLGLLLTVEIWIVIYNVFNVIYYDAEFSISELWRNMLFLKGTNMSHMWYMPVIIGIYLFIPLIANMLRSIDICMLTCPFMVAGLGIFAIPEIDLILQWEGYQPIVSQLDFSFSGGCYGIYLVIGYLAKKNLFDRFRSGALTLLGILGFAITVMVQIISYKKGIGYNVWYNNATLFITALAIFLLGLRYLKNGLGCINVAATALAQCSFGIYLIHNPILMCLRRVIETPFYYRKTITLFVFTLTISWIVVWLLSRNRIVARVMFDMKR